MIARETTVPGRGNMTASHQGGTRTEIATIAEEAAVAVTVVAEAGAGARIEPETEREIEFVAGAGHRAELGLKVEVRTWLMELNWSTVFYTAPAR